MKAKSLLFFLALAPLASEAKVALPHIFGDHMVLQQEIKLPVWGTADPGEKVTVTAGDRTAAAVAGPDGKWRADLDPFPGGTPPLTLTVQGETNTVTFTDVLIGDVWLCSGQSNMEATVASVYNGRETAANADDEQLRLFLTARNTSLSPLAAVGSPYYWGKKGPQKESSGDQPGKWVVCNRSDVSKFSALAYFFGRELRAHLKRPVGLIGTYWGGTLAEAWTSEDGLQKDPPFTTYLQARKDNVAKYPERKAKFDEAWERYLADLKAYEDRRQVEITAFQAAMRAWQSQSAAAKAAGQPAPELPKMAPLKKPEAPDPPDGGRHGPANLFNAMIAPLVPYGIKGVAWYQGESNTRGKSPEYRRLLPRLIADWREKWGEGDFPFLIVQISHFPYASDGSSALIREAQVDALALPSTALAVTADIPCDDAGHPHDKENAGKRLALAARRTAYGEDLVFSGPIYRGMKIEGNAVRIFFDHVGGGLMIGRAPYQPEKFGNRKLEPYPGDRLIGFTIAGADQKFVPAEALIDGDTVVVSSEQVKNPAAVRFGWGDIVEINLYNRENLPASPFRTDRWNAFKFRDLAPGLVAPTFTEVP